MRRVPRNSWPHLAGFAFLWLMVALGACSRVGYVFRPGPGYAPAAAPVAPVATSKPTAGPVAGRAQPAALLPGAPLRWALRPRLARRLAGRQLATRPARVVAGRAPAAWAEPTSRRQGTAQLPPLHHRTQGIALILALLLGGFGIHRFYLGYYWAGAAYLLSNVVGITLLSVGGLALLFGGSGTGAAAAVLGLAILLGLGVWALVDTVRIITGDLKPKNGDYYPKFFQIGSKP